MIYAANPWICLIYDGHKQFQPFSYFIFGKMSFIGIEILVILGNEIDTTEKLEGILGFRFILDSTGSRCTPIASHKHWFFIRGLHKWWAISDAGSISNSKLE